MILAWFLRWFLYEATVARKKVANIFYPHHKCDIVYVWVFEIAKDPSSTWPPTYMTHTWSKSQQFLLHNYVKI